MILAHIRDSFAAAFFPRVPEWTAAGVIFALGWMLAVNPDRMTTGTGQGYLLMLAIAEQASWSYLLMAYGFGRLVILLINGAWRRSPHLRAITAGLSCFLWTQIALSFLSTFGFAFIFACSFVVMDIINVLRAMGDARIVDDAYRGASGGHQ